MSTANHFTSFRLMIASVKSAICSAYLSLVFVQLFYYIRHISRPFYIWLKDTDIASQRHLEELIANDK